MVGSRGMTRVGDWICKLSLFCVRAFGMSECVLILGRVKGWGERVVDRVAMALFRSLFSPRDDFF